MHLGNSDCVFEIEQYIDQSSRETCFDNVRCRTGAGSIDEVNNNFVLTLLYEDIGEVLHRHFIDPAAADASTTAN